MPIGIVNNDEFNDELLSHENHHAQSKVTILNQKSQGRASGDVNVPDSLRKIIGEEAAINGSKDTKESLAGPLGISASSVSAYKKGAKSTASYNEPVPDLLAAINNGKERTIKRAQSKMFRALKHITDSKLEGAKAKDCAAIAKDMSAIIKNLEPEKITDSGRPQINFTFFAPKAKALDDYETITIGD